MTQQIFSNDYDLLNAARGNKATLDQFFEKFERDIEDASFEIIEGAKKDQERESFCSMTSHMEPETKLSSKSGPSDQLNAKDDLVKHMRQSLQKMDQTDVPASQKPLVSGLFFVPQIRSENVGRDRLVKFGLAVSTICILVAFAMPLHWALTYSNVEPEFVPDLGLRTGSITPVQMLGVSEDMMRQLIEPQTPPISDPQNGSSQKIETLSPSRTSSIVYFHSD